MRNSLIVGLMCLLSACGGTPSEFIEVCVESDVTLQPMFFPNGSGGMRMQMIPLDRCTRYETKRNPAYDEWVAENQGR